MPQKRYTRQDKLKILSDFLQYVNNTDHPIIKEFCIQNDIHDQTLRRFAQENKTKLDDRKGNIYDFEYVLKKSKAKQEVFLSKLTIEKGQNPGGSIFLLKALHGYKDSEPAQQPTTVNLNIEKVLQAQPDKLETGVQDLLQNVKIDNNRKRKPSQTKN